MATLKISDLSVGDWVEIDHEDYGWHPAQINVCGDLGIGVYFKDIDPEEEYDCTLSQARPIPITPEILEANGWEKDGRGYKWSNEKHRVFVWLKKFSHFVDVVEMDKQFATKNSCIEVSQLFVHQLQHALRLAGVGKEIIMPKE